MSGQSFRLFRLFGITVFLHWSWLLFAAYQFDKGSRFYGNPFLGLSVYIGLFALVLMHEFGHALACRQTGGFAREILLWPLGGVAYVQPPPRPGAHLWSIAAGPLVNVVLIPVFMILKQLPGTHNQYILIHTLAQINTMLLIFNLLPIYPLDGGQILRSLLWFKMGPIGSLKVASLIGLAGAGCFILFAILQREIWLGLIAVYAASIAWKGYSAARNASEY